MYTFAPKKKEDIVNFTRQAVDAKPKVQTEDKYVPPINKKGESVQKSFDELFPGLSTDVISFKMYKSQSEQITTNAPKSFAERIKEKLEREQREKNAAEAEKALPEEMRYMRFPNFTKFYRIREEAQRKKTKEKAWLNKIFDSSDDELAFTPEDNLSEMYPLDDDDEQDNNEDGQDGNEYD